MFVCREHLFCVMCVCVCFFWNFDPALIMLLMPSVLAKFVKNVVGGIGSFNFLRQNFVVVLDFCIAKV